MAADRKDFDTAPYIFVKPGRRDLVPIIVDKFSGMARANNQKVFAPGQIEARLNDLVNGEKVSVPVMNCIDFKWQAVPGRYPESTLNTNTDTSIAVFSKPTIEEILSDLRRLGDPRLSVIVPDSEIFDDRVFSYAQGFEQRQSAAAVIETGLAERFGSVPGADQPVTRWSRYCAVYELKKPEDYTTEAQEKIKGNPSLLSKVNRQIKDSKGYLTQHGIKEEDIADIPPAEVAERILWYLSMYTGEGIALKDNQALMLNFEDGRVPAWYDRGADGSLPILTPVNPNIFYSWRKEIKAGNIDPNKIS